MEMVLGSWVMRTLQQVTGLDSRRKKGMRNMQRRDIGTFRVLTRSGKLLVFLSCFCLFSTALAGIQRQDFALGFELQGKHHRELLILRISQVYTSLPAAWRAVLTLALLWFVP